MNRACAGEPHPPPEVGAVEGARRVGKGGRGARPAMTRTVLATVRRMRCGSCQSTLTPPPLRHAPDRQRHPVSQSVRE
jgi:hypothetical protein